MPHKEPLKDMKLTKDELSEKKEIVLGDRPKYPFGLHIHLNEESIQKLQLEELPEPGQKKILLARVVCEGVSSRETVDGGKDRTIELQITHMNLATSTDKERSSHKETADKLYG